MALTFNGINQSQIAITGGVTMAVTAPNVYIAVAASSVGNNAIASVPAGKKWTILNAQMFNVTGSVANLMTMVIDGAPVFANSSVGTMESPCVPVFIYDATYATGLKIPSGKAIVVNNTGATTACISLQIYEENN